MKNRVAAGSAGVLLLGVAIAGAGAPAAADVPRLTTVGAYGYFASVSLFGGPPNNSGPSPTVTAPAEGTRAPITTLVPSARAQFGPATVLESGEARVSVDPTPGQSGSLTSSASVKGVDEPPLPLLYEQVASTCTARGSELVGATTLAGELALSTYTAPDPREGEPRESVPLPPNPAPNTERTGELTHIGDRFRVVFNEQIRDGDVLTVNAVHMYLLGPIAVGDLVIAQSRCRVGAAATAGEPAPAASTTATTAVTAAAGTADPGPSEVAAADSEESSGNVLPMVVAGAVLALGVGGGALARRRRRGSRNTPW